MGLPMLVVENRIEKSLKIGDHEIRFKPSDLCWNDAVYIAAFFSISCYYDSLKAEFAFCKQSPVTGRGTFKHAVFPRAA